jgi:hypothetical protein
LDSSNPTLRFQDNNEPPTNKIARNASQEQLPTMPNIAGSEKLLAMNIRETLEISPSGSSFPLCFKGLGFNFGSLWQFVVPLCSFVSSVVKILGFFQS